jgi:S-adenosylmethionine-diacylglycerol 3-amino-3-carboxypropyl transferase
MRRKLVSQGVDSALRYAQCWEDADILLEALDIQPGFRCLSIASAGDNTLAMLSKAPSEVVAIDLSPAQLASLELRVAAFRELRHDELLVLIGSVEGDNRLALYDRCRRQMSRAARAFWDERRGLIQDGVGSAGQLERYFGKFRTRVLPLIHSHHRVEQLLTHRSALERERFYSSDWNNLRWRVLFRLFFSRVVASRLGRDPEFFRFVEGNVAGRILERLRYALTKLDPASNPYIYWMFAGQHTGGALPFTLRPENFEAIRANLDRLQWRCCSLERFLESSPGSFDAFNLSDIFEYVSPAYYEALLRLIIRAARLKARLAYWNLFVPRSRPESMAGSLKSLTDRSHELFARDKAFFYSTFVVEEVQEQLCCHGNGDESLSIVSESSLSSNAR